MTDLAALVDLDEADLADLMRYLSPNELAQLSEILAARTVWEPLPGPQTMAYHSLADELYYGGAAGGGKALALTTPIATPTGWSMMGDISVGDQVFNDRGEPVRVIAVSDVMRDHACYRVVFSDGSAIVADAAHKWLTCDAAERATSLRGSIRTTQDIAETLLSDCGEPNHAVPVSRQVIRLQRERARQPLPPRRTARLRYIVACEPVASVPVRCIGVDTPSHLYLAGESMIPTHNTDLLLGLAHRAHLKTIIFRREYPQLKGIEQRADSLFAKIGKYNKSDHYWSLNDGRLIEFGSVPHLDDKDKYQGRPHDLIGFDELPHFLELMYRFLIGWNRNAEHPTQRCRVVGAGNPPTNAEGEWCITYFAPWLDEHHANPAQPGELRWFTTLDGKDIEVGSGEPFLHKGKLIRPRSRTFIPAKIADNPYLMASGYEAVLQSLPEPLRSKMLNGDFKAGRQDHEQQTIPTEWVKMAQARWRERSKPEFLPMTAIGVDVARGGMDKTVLAPLYGNYVAEIETYPGANTPNGPIVAQMIISRMNGAQARINVDAIGVGASVVDTLAGYELKVSGLISSEKSETTDRSGLLGFINKRAQWWWKFREMLDPASGYDIALPDTREVLADLVAPRWKLTPRGIQIESKDDLRDRIGRSPDIGDAIVYAFVVEEENKPAFGSV